MATTAQLRAALAVLLADTDTAAEQAGIAEMSGTDMAGVEHALLAGMLYRMMGDDLRHSLTSAPNLTALEERARAAGPGTEKYASDDPAKRDEYCAQAHFEVYWLADRIAGLHFTAEPASDALQAAVHTTEATRTLLRIQLDHARQVGPEAEQADWDSVLKQLDRATALARVAHASTAPEEPFGAPTVDWQPAPRTGAERRAQRIGVTQRAVPEIQPESVADQSAVVGALRSIE
ncbi:MAG: hypothetical protein J2P18_12940 [Nocardia sp.]|nr:hypothetical protein [Nocardia sp.]